MTGIVDFRTSLLDEAGAPIDGDNPLPVTGGGGGGPTEVYALNDFLDGDPLYLGKVKADGTWLLQRFSATTGQMRYANVSNNAGVATYTSAWANRLTLTYSPFQELSNV
jgi:hypothetical protein